MPTRLIGSSLPSFHFQRDVCGEEEEEKGRMGGRGGEKGERLIPNLLPLPANVSVLSGVCGLVGRPRSSITNPIRRSLFKSIFSWIFFYLTFQLGCATEEGGGCGEELVPNQQRTLNKLPTELRRRNLVNKQRHRRQTCKNVCALCAISSN